MQIAMPAGAEDEARAFFAGVLGMTEVPKPPILALRGGVWFRSGGVELHLGGEENFVPDRKGHPGILVDDIEDVAGRLTRGGYPARWDDEFPGFRRIYSNDPFGNRMEFLQAA